MEALPPGAARTRSPPVALLPGWCSSSSRNVFDPRRPWPASRSATSWRDSGVTNRRFERILGQRPERSEVQCAGQVEDEASRCRVTQAVDAVDHISHIEAIGPVHHEPRDRDLVVVGGGHLQLVPKPTSQVEDLGHRAVAHRQVPVLEADGDRQLLERQPFGARGEDVRYRRLVDLAEDTVADETCNGPVVEAERSELAPSDQSPALPGEAHDLVVDHAHGRCTVPRGAAPSTTAAWPDVSPPGHRSIDAAWSGPARPPLPAPTLGADSTTVAGSTPSLGDGEARGCPGCAGSRGGWG